MFLEKLSKKISKKKLIYITYILVLVFVVSGCNKKIIEKDNNSKILNNNINEVKPEVKSIDSKENVDIKNSPISSSSPVVKISNLKVGDKFGNLVVKKINGHLCESDCKEDFGGGIEFDGETIMAGRISYTPDYSLNVWFEPSEGYGLPVISLKEDKSSASGLIVEGIVKSRDGFAFYNPQIINYNDYSLISKKLIDFPNFVKEANLDIKPVVYEKEVLIKINNYKIGMSTGGEGLNSANLVEIIKVLD